MSRSFRIGRTCTTTTSNFCGAIGRYYVCTLHTVFSTMMIDSPVSLLCTVNHMPQFFSGECGTSASFRPNNPSSSMPALATVQNGSVRHGRPEVAKNVDMLPKRAPETTALEALSTMLDRVSTKNAATAMLERAELYPQRPKDTSDGSAPQANPTRHPEKLPPTACNASFGE